MAKPRRRPEGEQNLPDPSIAGSSYTEGAGQGSDRSPDRIAARAYELYLARGGSDGQDFDDWLAAERELASGPSQGQRNE